MKELTNQNTGLSGERTEKVIANEINYIKRRTCETVLSASVEIGRLLCEAKTKVAGGEWMAWLSENVNYSQSTANNLMRLYEEYGEKEQLGFFEENRIEIFGDISPSQALALIALPYTERKEYVKTHDMSETSVRDISAEIKARKEAESRAAALKNELDAVRAGAAEIEAKESDYLSEIEELKGQLALLESGADDSEGTLLSEEREAAFAAEKAEAVKAAKAEIKAKLEKKLAVLQDKVDAAESEKAAAVEAAKAQAANDSKAAFTEELESLRAEADSYRKKAEAAASGGLQRFSAYFELFQNVFGELVSSLDKLRAEGDGNADKLAEGVKGVLDVMKEKISH